MENQNKSEVEPQQVLNLRLKVESKPVINYHPKLAPSKELIAASEALKGVPVYYDKNRDLYYYEDPN